MHLNRNSPLNIYEIFVFFYSNIWNNEHQSVNVYRARIWSNNSFLVTLLAFEYSLLHSQDMYTARVQKTNARVGIIDAIGDALHTYIEDQNGNEDLVFGGGEQQTSKYIFIQFPEILYYCLS